MKFYKQRQARLIVRCNSARLDFHALIWGASDLHLSLKTYAEPPKGLAYRG